MWPGPNRRRGGCSLAVHFFRAAILRGLLTLHLRAAAFLVFTALATAARGCRLVFAAAAFAAAIFAARGCGLVLVVLHAGHNVLAAGRRVLARATRGGRLVVFGLHVALHGMTCTARGRVLRVTGGHLVTHRFFRWNETLLRRGRRGWG